MNFSEEMFYENYLTSDFHTKNCYFKTCLPTRQNGTKTIIRPIRASLISRRRFKRKLYDSLFLQPSVTSVKLSLEYQLYSDNCPQHSDNNEEFARPNMPNINIQDREGQDQSNKSPKGHDEVMH